MTNNDLIFFREGYKFNLVINNFPLFIRDVDTLTYKIIIHAIFTLKKFDLFF